MATTVVNIHSGEPYDVYIGRPRQWKTSGNMGLGNPFVVGKDGTNDECVEKFIPWFENEVKNNPVYKKKVLSCRNKRVGCFCKPKRCHGDVIALYCDGGDNELPTG